MNFSAALANVLILPIFFLIGAGQAHGLDNLAQYAAIQRISQEMEPRLRTAGNDFERMVLLRNQIYQRVPVRDTVPGFPFETPLQAYVLSIFDPEYGHLCRGLANVYLIALQAWGIEGRLVSLFDDRSSPYNGHSTVEVYLSGRWYASDPTMNAMFRNPSGDYLDYAQLRELVLAKQVYRSTSNGLPQSEVKPMGEWIPLYESYLNYMIRHANDLHAIRQIYPAGWDGKVDNQLVEK